MALSQSQLDILNRSGTTPSFTPQKKKIWSGGFFSDVIDTLSVPSYAVAGLLDPDETVFGAIKNRQTVADTLGVKNPFLAFIVDVATDPLTYTGFGALTKVKGVGALKEGKLAATLAGQSAKGERALVTVFGQSVIKGDKVFQGITRATEFIKQTVPHADTVLSKGFGAREALKSTPYWDLERVEMAAGRLDEVKKMGKNISRAKEAATKEYLSVLNAVARDIQGQSKKLGTSLREVAQTFTKKAYNNSVAIPVELEESFKRLKDLSEKMQLDLSKVTDNLIDSYQVPSVLKEQADHYAAGLAMREMGGEVSKLKLRTYTGFQSGAVQAGEEFVEGAYTVGGHIVSDTRAVLADGKVLERIGDAYYDADDMIKLRKASERIAKDRLQATEQAKQFTKTANSLKGKIKNLEKKLEPLEKATDVDSKAMASILKRDLATAKAQLTRTLSSRQKTYDFIDQTRKTDFDHLLGLYRQNVEKHLSKRAFTEKQADHAHKIFKTVDTSVDHREATYEYFNKTKNPLERDYFKLMGIRAYSVASAMARKDFIEGAKGFGRKIVKGETIPDGWATSSLDELKGFVFPKEMVDHIDKTHVRYQDFREIGKFIAGYDQLLNLTKGMLTYVNIAFHSRNIVSNLWNMSYVLDVDEAIKATVQTFGLQKRIMQGSKIGDMFAYVKDPSEIADVTEALKRGLVNAGAFTADIEGMVYKVQNITPLRWGKAIGTFFEDVSKLAMYRTLKKKGYSAEQAAEQVHKYLFDYGDLTSFERNFLKRALPFYTWSRKNIPLQLAMLVQRPDRFTQIGHFRDEMERWANGEPMDEKYMPEWLKEAMPVYLGTGSDGLQKFIKLEGYIPAVDINLLSRPGEFLLEGGTPLIKTPLEMLMNYDTFTEKAITEYPGQKERFMGMYVSPKTEKVLSLIRPLNEVNKLLGLSDIKETPDLGSRVMNFIIGKTYDFSLDKQRKTFEYLQMLQEQLIEKDIKQARSKGELGEVKRLKELLKKVKKGETITL